MGLTAKQSRFVEEYLVDLNATQAAIRAGYSPDSAREIGCENLTKTRRGRSGRGRPGRALKTGRDQG